MKKNTDPRSSILKSVDENHTGGTSKNLRRVSWHSVRIVKEFGTDTDEVSGTPKHELMHLSDGSTLSSKNVFTFSESENNPSVNVLEGDATMTTPPARNEIPNQTLMFFQNGEQSHVTPHRGNSTVGSEPTLDFFDQLPRNITGQESSNFQGNTTHDGLEQTMGFFVGLDRRFVSPGRINSYIPKFDFTPVHVKFPTSEFSPTFVDTGAKKLFDESGISPIKGLPNIMETEDVDMVEEILQEDAEMDVTEEMEKITIDDKENFKTNEKPEDGQNEFNSPIMFEVSQKIREASLKVMAEHNPRLEELKEKARRLSDKMAEVAEARRRSSLLNSPADQINATLSEMFEKPRAESNQMLSDPGIAGTISERSIILDSLIESGGLERQSSDLFSKSLNSSGVGGTYTIHRSENSAEKILESKVNVRSFHSPNFPTPHCFKDMQMLDDIDTPTQIITMNDSEFLRATLDLNNLEKSDADPSLVEAMIHDDIMNVTTPTKRSVSKSGGTFTINSEGKSKIVKSIKEEEEIITVDVLNSQNNSESSFHTVSSSNTLPIAPLTPGCNTSSYLRNLNILIPLEDDEEEEKEISAINRFPHLAELIKEEKIWKESQGKNTSVNYSKKFYNNDSLIGNNSFVMAEMMGCTPGKGMRGMEPLEPLEFFEELGNNTSGQSFLNSSINSEKIERQKNSDAYTMSSYGCCIRHLNPDEASLMCQLESQIEQLKVFGANLNRVVPEISKICGCLKAEWIVYEERQLLSSIYYLAEITIVDLLFKALNGFGIDKKINEILFCTAKKAEEAYSTAVKLFDEMRITFPKSKFAEKLGNAFFKDRSNPEKKESYSKRVLERKGRNNELKKLHTERMKELKQKVDLREQELLVEGERLNQLYEFTIAKVAENFKKLVQ